MDAKYSLIFYQYKMTQYKSLNVKLSNSQLNKLKPLIKNETGVTLRLSSNTIGSNETNFTHELLSTTDKFRVFENLLQTIHQSILSCQKPNYQRLYNQEDFLVDYLVHY